MAAWTPDAVVDHFARLSTLHEDERRYLLFHRARYAFLLSHADDVVPAVGPDRPIRILDIGPSFQTVLLRDHFAEAEVNTLGVEDPATVRRAFTVALLAEGRHFRVDLNDPEEAGTATVPVHDVVVMAEVIEHLHVAPTAVLRYLSGLLEPGGWLILQTPNACALHKRLKMAIGRNPLAPIEEWRYEAHFHEYTVRELTTAGREVGLSTVTASLANYFTRDTRASTAYNRLAKVLPPTLRAGITMTFRKG